MAVRLVQLIGLALAAAIVALPVQAPAQRTSVNGSLPALKHSAQRRAILDAVRDTVEERMGEHARMTVRDVRVRLGWAIVFAEIAPARRRAALGPAAESTFTAILGFRDGRWTVLDHAVDAGDSWHCDNAQPAPRRLTGC